MYELTEAWVEGERVKEVKNAVKTELIRLRGFMRSEGPIQRGARELADALARTAETGSELIFLCDDEFENLVENLRRQRFECWLGHVEGPYGGDGID